MSAAISKTEARAKELWPGCTVRRVNARRPPRAGDLLYNYQPSGRVTVSRVERIYSAGGYTHVKLARVPKLCTTTRGGNRTILLSAMVQGNHHLLTLPPTAPPAPAPAPAPPADSPPLRREVEALRREVKAQRAELAEVKTMLGRACAILEALS